MNETSGYSCAPTHKHERYSRVADRRKYETNFTNSNIGKHVNPMLGRKFHKTYSDKLDK